MRVYIEVDVAAREGEDRESVEDRVESALRFGSGRVGVRGAFDASGVEIRSIQVVSPPDPKIEEV